MFLSPAEPTAFAALRATIAPRPLALMFDVDGTLSPLAPTPGLAIVPEPTRAILRLLASRGAFCAAVSGRSALDAHRLVGVDELMYVGNHGLDQVVAGAYSVLPRAAAFAPLIEAALRDVQRQVDLPGMIFEPKGPTASVHYRLSDDPEHARTRALEALAPWQGQLRITEGKFVVEIRPPVDASKGDGVRDVVAAAAARGALYAGDDITDIDAFRAIGELRSQGLPAVSIAVCDVETPEAVRSAADIEVAGIAGMQALMAWLAETVLPEVGGPRQPKETTSP